MIKAVIIDDEDDVRFSLNYLITKHIDDVEVIGMADGVISGLKLIKEKNPDLIYLDLAMRDGSGFDLLDNLDETINVIFITAHEEHAIKAFKYSAIDYLLKPIDKKELQEATKKANKEIIPRPAALEILKKNTAGKHPEKLILKDINGYYIVAISDIIFCKSENYYTRFFIKGDVNYLISKPLKYYENLLIDRLIRVHQSYLVNFDYLVSMDKKDGGMLILHDKSQIPVSNRKKEMVIKYLLNMGRI